MFRVFLWSITWFTKVAKTCIFHGLEGGFMVPRIYTNSQLGCITRLPTCTPCHWFEPLCRWHSQVHIASQKTRHLFHIIIYIYILYIYTVTYMYIIYVVYMYIIFFCICILIHLAVSESLKGRHPCDIVSTYLKGMLCSSNGISSLNDLGAENKKCERKQDLLVILQKP